MDNQSPETVRTAAYLAARERLDVRTAAVRKTRPGKLNCTPGNKPCGSRCIPQNWDCRLKGEGRDNHTTATRTDPLSGIASIQRGAKDLARGVVTVNPARVERGRNSLIRGVVKLTPGDNVQKKKELQRQLKQASTPIAAVLGLTLVGLSAHAGLKRGFASYRNGVGADVDRAAARAVDSVLDRIPGVAGPRAAARAAASTAAGDIAISALRGAQLQSVRQATSGNLGRIGPLSFRPSAANYEASNLVNQLNELNGRARSGGLSYDEWQRSSVQALYGARSPGTRANGQRGSVFSEHAANEFLVSKFGLSGQGAVGPNGNFSMAARNALVDQQLGERLGSWGQTLREDMRLRRFMSPDGQIRSADVDRYITEIGTAGLGTRFAGLNAPQQRQLNSETTRLMRTVITGNARTMTSEARSMRRALVAEYDTYFSNVAQGMQRNAAASDSPFGDGLTGLARYVTRTTGQTTQILSRDHADLVLRHHYHTRVMRLQNDFTIGDNTARRVAQSINRSTDLPDTDTAYRILTENGFPRLVRSGPATGRAPQRLRNLSELTADILARPGNENMTRAAAQREARRLIKRREQRSDANPEPNQMRTATFLALRADLQAHPRLGKPCGASYIPKAHECQKGTAGSINQKTGDRSATYRTKQLSSIALRLGLTGALGLLAIRELNKAKGNSTLAMYLGVGAALGAASLTREIKVTKSPKQLNNEFESLKKEEGVEPETIDKIKKFIEEAGVDVQRVDAVKALALGGYFTTDKPNRIHIVGGQPVIKGAIKGSPEASYSQGVASYMEARRSFIQLNGQSSLNPAVLKKLSTEQRMRFFMGATSIANPKGQQMYLISHELGHAIHYRSDFATPQSVTVNGRRYEGDNLERELRRSTSIYGLSDITRSTRPIKGNYYTQGNRLETFAENFALFVGNGTKMKELYPVSYEWTKQTLDHALMQPARKTPFKMKTTIQELSKGTERFEPLKRKDAELNFEAVLIRMLNAVEKGDLNEALDTLRDASELPPEELALISPLLETVQMYASMG